MKARIAELIAALRRSGVPVSVAESIDAAAAAAVVGVERAALCDALAATLVKDARDRPLFDEAFERVFPPRPPAPPRFARRRRAAPGGDVASGAAGSGFGAPAAGGRGDPRVPPPEAAAAAKRGARARSASVREREAERRHAGPAWDEAASPAAARTPHPDAKRAEASAKRAEAGAERAEAGPLDERAEEEAGALGRRQRDLAHRRRERELLTMSFPAMSPRDIEEAAVLVRALSRRFTARLRRRLQPRARGRLDFRRTIRAAVPRGGVPVERHYRGRRPGKLALVALCDLSGSVATAAGFFLALLAPAPEHFASVRFFGFVDHLVEIEFADGHVRPAGPIDLMAHSDFGRVLVEFMAGPGAELTANVLLLVLGDARNNRRPPRADLFAAARARVRRLLWLNPDSPARWNIGDSVIASYARHADAVVPCSSLVELDRALVAVGRL